MQYFGGAGFKWLIFHTIPQTTGSRRHKTVQCAHPPTPFTAAAMPNSTQSNGLQSPLCFSGLRKSYLSQFPQPPPGKKQWPISAGKTEWPLLQTRSSTEQETHTHTHTHVTAEVNESWGGEKVERQTDTSRGDIHDTNLDRQRERRKTESQGGQTESWLQKAPLQ